MQTIKSKVLSLVSGVFGFAQPSGKQLKAKTQLAELRQSHEKSGKSPHYSLTPHHGKALDDL